MILSPHRRLRALQMAGEEDPTNAPVASEHLAAEITAIANGMTVTTIVETKLTDSFRNVLEECAVNSYFGHFKDMDAHTILLLLF